MSGINPASSIKLRFFIVGKNDVIIKKYSIAQANNLQRIIKRLKESCKAEQIELYQDKQKKVIEFKSDEEIIQYFNKGRAVYCKVLLKSIDVSTISIQSNVNDTISQPKSKSQILTLLKEEIKEEVKEVQKIKEDKELVKEEFKEINNNQLVQNMRKTIQNLLKMNIDQIAQNIYQNIPQNNKSFKYNCSFCHKTPNGTLFACELNLKIVSCKQCSPYLKYKLPFPFKAYTDPSIYQQEKDQQSKSSNQQQFKNIMQKERRLRNQRISERLRNIQIFID